MAETAYGIQMYCVRDITEDSMRLALKRIAEMGYGSVEFAGFFDYTAEQIKLWLDTFGLTCYGTHTGMKSLTAETIEETIRYHKAIGCSRITIPSASYSTAEKLNETIENMKTAHKRLAEEGIRLAYHNHSKEFFPNEDGLIFMDELLARTEIPLQVDTFWLYNAGYDPVPYLEAHKARIDAIHLKDGLITAPENRNFEHSQKGVIGKAVGEGEAPCKAVRAWAIQNRRPIVIESEGLDPTGLEEIGRCIDYLHTLDEEA
ncbi:MAG: sugar phosphate isomerase/epimerase [Clostridia bacterium]|nr:sugar phosphate isomerase/epimerase [Clostridia bacterium]